MAGRGPSVEESGRRSVNAPLHTDMVTIALRWTVRSQSSSVSSCSVLSAGTTTMSGAVQSANVRCGTTRMPPDSLWSLLRASSLVRDSGFGEHAVVHAAQPVVDVGWCCSGVAAVERWLGVVFHVELCGLRILVAGDEGGEGE